MNLRKIKESHIYNNMFGFESNIDITNDVEVLYRKNIVIKNIIFVSNLVYTLIFTIVALGEPSNWLLTIIFIPVTFLVNKTLKSMIYKDKDSLLNQQIAMYMCCFYMFLSAILIYTKLKTGTLAEHFGEVGYILLYYSLVICSFYQDKKMLKVVYKWAFLIITIIHFSLTYNILFGADANTGEGFLITFVQSYEFRDIVSRTCILLVFMLVLYVSASMSGYMQDERKKELMKRQETEREYTDVITKIFNTTLTERSRSVSEKEQIELIALMSKKIASLYGKNMETCNEVYEYAKVHIVSKFDFYLDNILDADEKFEKIKEETRLGSIVLSRLQLERKTEDIIRTHLEGSETKEFTERMLSICNNLEEQMIMLSDMYVSLRSIRSYKRAYNHKTTLNFLENTYKMYFDTQLLERFMRFSDEFENLYDNFEVNSNES